MNRFMKHSRKKYSKYEEGKIQCVICGGWYHLVCSHVVQRHNLTTKEYKELVNHVSFRGIMSDKSKGLARRRVFENPDCIDINLKEKGKNTRIKKGSNFRNGIR